MIDYHEQHRYAYELLGLEDRGASESAPRRRGQSKSAQAAYARDMTAVFRNVARKVRPGGRLIVVAGDRHGLYPDILSGAGLEHEATLKRHVNRRTGAGAANSTNRSSSTRSGSGRSLVPKATGPGGPAIGETVFSDPKVKAAVEDVIISMMDRVMEKVLVTDPFDKDRFRREKPLYAALVPDKIFIGSHFERRFVTPFGKVWERLVQMLGQANRGSPRPTT